MKRKKLLTYLLILVGALCYVEIDTSQFAAEKSAIINVNSDELFQFLILPDTVERWFRMVTHFRSADMKPMVPGKLFQVIYSLPMLGKHMMLLRLVKFDPEYSQVVLESDCFFKTRVEITAVPYGPNECSSNLTMKLTFRQKSAFFQWTIAPVLQYHALNQLNQSFHLLNKMVPA
ncbi:uncharacterized protein LOC124160196 [Ischnura elegans]|uniref:uncharacterized protein LOC124160196 n=1 Tax=Ischnura elegans TaxID=197161 RepID=UPI001ED88A6C|nr:uncharacterized protein LOC124160196 [Ischnura elegans]